MVDKLLQELPYPQSFKVSYEDLKFAISGDEKRLENFIENLETILSEVAPGAREFVENGFKSLMNSAVPLVFENGKDNELEKLIKIMKKIFPEHSDDDPITMLKFNSVSRTVCLLLEAGKKKEARKELLKAKEDADQFILKFFNKKSEVLFLMYHAYFSFYANPVVCDYKKAVFNGVKHMMYGWKSGNLSLQDWFHLLIMVNHLCYKVNAFRQSHYLIRAAKVFMDDVKERHKSVVLEDDLVHFEAGIMMAKAIHIVNLLMTLKEHELAPSEEGEKRFELNMELVTFDDIQIPDGEAILDGNVKDFVELQKLYFKAKIMKNVALMKDEELDDFCFPGSKRCYLESLEAKFELLDVIFSFRK